MKALTKLVQGSGQRAVETYAPKSNEALLTFATDRSTERPGGVKVTWAIKPLQPPERPAPPTVDPNSVTVDSVRVLWSKPESTLPIEAFLLQAPPNTPHSSA